MPHLGLVVNAVDLPKTRVVSKHWVASSALWQALWAAACLEDDSDMDLGNGDGKNSRTGRSPLGAPPRGTYDRSLSFYHLPFAGKNKCTINHLFSHSCCTVREHDPRIARERRIRSLQVGGASTYRLANAASATASPSRQIDGLRWAGDLTPSRARVVVSLLSCCHGMACITVWYVWSCVYVLACQ